MTFQQSEMTSNVSGVILCTFALHGHWRMYNMNKMRRTELIIKNIIEEMGKHYGDQITVSFGYLSSESCYNIKTTTQTTLDDYVDTGLDKIPSFKTFDVTFNRKCIDDSFGNTVVELLQKIRQ